MATMDGGEKVRLSFERLHYTVNVKGSGLPKALLQNINGDVTSGHVLAILGPSGAGKTTLLNALTLQQAGGSTAASKRERPVVLEPSLERKRRGGQRLPARVLMDAVAMCEVKRDSSDVGKAVAKSAEVMAWLSGERGGYDPAEWTNRNYPCGHFGLDADGTTERVHACTSGGVTYLFDRRSFANFCGGAESRIGQPTLPQRLHIVTSTRRRAGYDTVRPVCSRVFGRMQHKASRDIELLGALRSHEAAEQYDWEALRLWLREGTASLSAVGALRLFAADAAAAERLHVEVDDEQADDE